MTFANPFFLYNLIFLLPVMAIFFLWANRRREAALARLGNPSLVQRLSATVNWRGRRWRNLLWFVALVMLMISLARPQWGSESREVEQEGIEVMVALDVSNSMLAQDIKPDRLTRAKLEISDLMNRLGALAPFVGRPAEWLVTQLGMRGAAVLVNLGDLFTAYARKPGASPT